MEEYIKNTITDVIAGIKAAADEINGQQSGMTVSECLIEVKFSLRDLFYDNSSFVEFTVPCSLTFSAQEAHKEC